jgi:hypothetical protein
MPPSSALSLAYHANWARSCGQVSMLPVRTLAPQRPQPGLVSTPGLTWAMLVCTRALRQRLSTPRTPATSRCCASPMSPSSYASRRQRRRAHSTRLRWSERRSQRLAAEPAAAAAPAETAVAVVMCRRRRSQHSLEQARAQSSRSSCSNMRMRAASLWQGS